MMNPPKVIGVCGLIGAGKSVVRHAMAVLYGLPTFDSDEEAKKLYFVPEVRMQIVRSLGFDPISGNELDKAGLSKCIALPEQKKTLESIVHTALEMHWHAWISQQQSPAVVLESAILYTSGYSKYCDTVVAVTAPEDVRRMRVHSRDGAGRGGRFEAIEKLQMEERQLQEMRAEYKVVNTDDCSIILQLEQLQDSLLSK